VKMRLQAFTCVFWFFFTPLLAFYCPSPAQGQEEEKTYSINLVKTAEVERDIREVGDKKILTQEYTVRNGEYIWKILREKGLLKTWNLPELLSVLKKLNSSLPNLHLVHPGEKVIIPLRIVPISTGPLEERPSSVEVTPVSSLKEMEFENYTVMPGNSLIRIAKGRYKIRPKELRNEYLPLLMKLNPAIKNLNIIHPGQVIRLPIFSPEIVRKPIEPAISQRPEGQQSPLASGLSEIFLEMGEEWVQTGEHFIPLKSGGQIDLKANSFPIVNLRSGRKLIVDLQNKLPEKIGQLIESSWENYRVVRLMGEDNLGSALDKILSVSDYPKVSKRGEAIGLKGEIALEIAGDWVITLSENPTENRPSLVVINLTDPHSARTPQVIKNYLSGLNVKVIDYPPAREDLVENSEEAKKLGPETDPASLVSALLSLTGHSFSTQVKIPVYQSKNAGFKLIINADFLLSIKGRDAIIDVTGLAPEIISFLEEHQLSILSLAAEKEHIAMVAKMLEFLGVQYRAGSHSFKTSTRDDSKNITLTLSGIVFNDHSGKAILVTPLNLPDEIVTFLSLRGYQVFVLASS